MLSLHSLTVFIASRRPVPRGGDFTPAPRASARISIMLTEMLRGEQTVNMTAVDCEIIDGICCARVSAHLYILFGDGSMNTVNLFALPGFGDNARSRRTVLGGLADASPLAPPSVSANALAGFLSPMPTSFLGGGLGMLTTSPPVEQTNALASALLAQETKRKAYFAFRFADIMRVNNVRNAWRIDHPESEYKRSFFDRSIWGKSKAQEPESLKALMRNAVVQSSAICVLVGANTWQGRWVKYEIARSVVDERGLLAVHINGIKHINRLTVDERGLSPLHVMGIFHNPNGLYYIYENFVEVDAATGLVGFAWRPYQDFRDPVSLPRYIPSIPQGLVMPLSRYTVEYDYMAGNGNRNIGAWVDAAAMAVGR